MKKFAIAVLAIMAVVSAVSVTGCKKAAKDEVEQKAYAAGLAAGYASTLIPKISAEDKTNIVAIVTVAEKFAPEAGATIAATWTPVIDKVIDRLAQQEKLGPGQDVLVRAGVALAVKGLDYLLDQHPKWKEDQELVNAAIHKACAGFRAGIGIDPGNPDIVELIESLMDKDVFAVCAPKGE